MFRLTETNTNDLRVRQVIFARNKDVAETLENAYKNGVFENVSASVQEKKLYCDSLVLEIGRKCNMKCAHCLRGNAEDCSMQFKTAVRALNLFDSIGTITFSGGEPTLYSEEIIHIINYIIFENIEVGNFYMATNGTNLSIDLMIALCRLYAHCYDKDCCSLEVSRDDYHENVPVPEFMTAFSFFGERGRHTPESALLIEGRAEENGIGGRKPKREYEFDFFEEDETVELVYVNCFGELFADCDYSYETQRRIWAYSLDDIYNGDISPEEVFENSYKRKYA